MSAAIDALQASLNTLSAAIDTKLAAIPQQVAAAVTAAEQADATTIANMQAEIAAMQVKLTP